MSAVQTLIVWEDLDVSRYELKHPSTGGETMLQCPVVILRPSRVATYQCVWHAAASTV